MVEAVTGAAIAGIVALGYLLLVEVMAAAILLLCQFVVLQWRSLRALVVEPPPAVPVPVPSGTAGDQGEPYRIGGGLAHWDRSC